MSLAVVISPIVVRQKTQENSIKQEFLSETLEFNPSFIHLLTVIYLYFHPTHFSAETISVLLLL